jgi:hypothetical protein
MIGVSIMKNFIKHFKNKDFKAAQKEFDTLNDVEKQTIFSRLFQAAEYANRPHSISVLFRELHEGKTFEDFHEAWFPPADTINTQTIDGQLYHQLFKAPIRVINAVNINNPKEIVSVGIHWLNEEQANEFSKMLKGQRDETGERRGDSIAHVAEKKRSDVFIVESDDNLGTPF